MYFPISALSNSRLFSFGFKTTMSLTALDLLWCYNRDFCSPVNPTTHLLWNENTKTKKFGDVHINNSGMFAWQILTDLTKKALASHGQFDLETCIMEWLIDFFVSVWYWFNAYNRYNSRVKYLSKRSMHQWNRFSSEVKKCLEVSRTFIEALSKHQISNDLCHSIVDFGMRIKGYTCKE